MNRFVLLSFAVLSIVFSTVTLSASTDNAETMPTRLKVALLSRTFSNEAFHDPVRDIETDYVVQLANKLDLETEFTVYPNVNAIQQALRSAEVDIAVGLSDFAGDEFIYSTPLYNSSVAIWYRNKNLVHMYPKQMKWACVKDSVYCHKLFELGFQNIIESVSFADAINHVNSGDADTVLDSYVSLLAFVNSGQRTIGRLEIPEWFNTKNIRISAMPENQSLMQRINQVLEQSPHSEALTYSNLYHKVDQVSAAFHRNSNKSIRYTVWEDSYPLFYRDTSGELVGYIPDILKLVESRTSIRFDYVAISNGRTPLEMLESGDIDFLPSVTLDAHDLDWSSVSEPITSIRYFSVRYKTQSPVTHNNEGVLFSDEPAYMGIKNKIFGDNTATYTSVKALFRDLKAGELNHAYVREDILDYLITNDDESRLIINRREYKDIDVSLTVRKDNGYLSDLIQGVTSTVNASEIRRIQNEYSPFNIIYGYDKSVVIIGMSTLAGIILLLVFIGALWYKNFKLKAAINRKAAQQTKDDLTFLQSIINGLPNQIFIHDVNSQLLLSNCVGVASGRCKSCSLSQYGSEMQKVVENSEELQRVLELGEIIKRDVEVQTCSAGFQSINYYRTKIQGPSGLKELVLTVVNDVSAEKEQERALRSANDTAQQAVQSRERFLASMSHELRTPIAGMAGLLEMLKIRTQDEDTLMLIDNIITSTRHLHLLVNDILDFSKLEAQQLELDLIECHLLREAGELLRVHCASAHKKDLQFEVNWKPSPIKVVKIDPLRFSQIINNLLSNAIKFTDVGKITVDVELDEQQIHVAVSDTGEGMSKDVIQTVFNPFFQADSTIARRFGGTGLGLSIVHNLIKVMGGDIHIESEVGKGSTVSFTIPHEMVRTYKESNMIVCANYHGSNSLIANWIHTWTSNSDDSCAGCEIEVYDEEQFDLSLRSEPCIVIKKNLDAFRSRDGNCVYVNSTPLFPDLLFDAVVGADKHTVVDEEEARVSLDGKVLIAEDNPINQLVFKQQLDELGVEVDIVDNGLIALELLQANPTSYDLLITDCHMPVMDGYELVNRVRQLAELRHLTVIGCTAEDSRVATEKAQISGFDSVLYKPYGIKTIYKLLAKYLSSPEQASAGFWIDNYDQADANILSHVYVDTMRSDLILLAEAKNDQKKLREIAHRIKGGAGTIGETNIHQRASELEECMQNREGNLAELFDVLVADINTSIKQTEAWINEQRA